MAEVEPLRPACRCLAVERAGGVTVLRFTRSDVGDDDTVRDAGRQLLALLDGGGHTRFLLDFGSVSQLSSATLALLVAFHKRVHQAGGRLTLCSLAPELLLKFQRSRLDALFPICPTEQEALRHLQADPPAG